MLWFDWMISGVFSFYVLYVAVITDLPHPHWLPQCLSIPTVSAHFSLLNIHDDQSPTVLCSSMSVRRLTLWHHKTLYIYFWLDQSKALLSLCGHPSLALTHNWRLLVYVWITWEMRQRFLQLVKGTSRAHNLEPCIGPYHLGLFGPHQHQHVHFMRNQKPVHASPMCLSAILHHSTSYVHRWHRDGPIFVIYHEGMKLEINIKSAAVSSGDYG